MQHRVRFSSLSDQLRALALCWRESAFCDPDLAWRQCFPSLSEACLGLTDESVDRMERQPESLYGFLADHIGPAAIWYGGMAVSLAAALGFVLMARSRPEQIQAQSVPVLPVGQE